MKPAQLRTQENSRTRTAILDATESNLGVTAGHAEIIDYVDTLLGKIAARRKSNRAAGEPTGSAKPQRPRPTT